MRTLLLKDGYYLKFNKGIYPIDFAIKHDLIFLDEVADLLPLMRAKKLITVDVDDILENEPCYRREPHLKSSYAILNGTGSNEPKIKLASEYEAGEALDFFERHGGSILFHIEELYKNHKERCLIDGDFSDLIKEKTKQESLIADRNSIDKLLQGLSLRSDVTIPEYSEAIKMILQLERKVFFYACELGEELETLLQIHNIIKNQTEFLATLADRRENESAINPRCERRIAAITFDTRELSKSYEEEKSRQEQCHVEKASEKPNLRHPAPVRRINPAQLELDIAATPVASYAANYAASHARSRAALVPGFLSFSQSKAVVNEDPFKKEDCVPTRKEVQDKAKKGSILSEIFGKKS